MNKLFAMFIVVVSVLLSIIVSGCQSAAKVVGGTITVTLPAGRQLEEITWKNGNLWVLHKERAKGAHPEEHIFQEYSDVGMINAKVIVKEN